MSRDDVLSREREWADRLLVDVRQHVEPTEQDAARNLAGLEQRLLLSMPAEGAGVARAGDGAAASAGTLLQLRPGTPALAGTAAGARAAGAASGWKSAGVLGRWLAFGATSALLGYLGGRFESRQEQAELQRALQQQARPMEPQQLQVPELQQRPAPEPQQLQVPELQQRPAPEPQQLQRSRRAPPVAASATPPRVVTAPERRAKEQLREAIELLQRAEAALRQGDAFAASLLLSDLERTTPAHLLQEERLATRALVGCALGDEASAAAALRELEQLNPESIYRARLEGSCAEKKPRALSKEPPAPH